MYSLLFLLFFFVCLYKCNILSIDRVSTCGQPDLPTKDVCCLSLPVVNLSPGPHRGEALLRFDLYDPRLLDGVNVGLGANWGGDVVK